MKQFSRKLRIVLAPLVSIGLLAFLLWGIDVSRVVESFFELSPVTVLALIFLMSLNLLVVSYRLHVVTALVGASVPIVASLRANLAGLLSSLFVFNLFGSMVGRYFLLRRHGVPPGSVAVVTFVERLLLAFVGGGVFVLGVLFLLGGDALVGFMSELNLFGFSAVTIAVLAFLATCMRSNTEVRLLKRLVSKHVLGRVGSAVVITLVSQAIMLFVYVVAARGFALDLPVMPLLAAAAIIVFAASVPITVNGWGVRELAAVYVLGELGVNEPTALSLSFLVGLTATVAVLAASPLLFYKEKLFPKANSLDTGSVSKNPGDRTDVAISHSVAANPARADLLEAGEKWFALIVGISAALLVFFQVHVNFLDTKVSVNLVDPLALLAAVTVALLFTRSRRVLEAVPRPFAYWLVAVTITLLAGFLLGYTRIGLTQWALTNRLAGWGVLLGYLSLGAALVHIWGMHGLRRFCEVTLIAAAVIVTYTVIRRELMFQTGFGSTLSPVLEGFAFNRNAFAFQLLIAASGALAFSKTMVRVGRGALWSVLLGIVLFGIWRTQSKTALVAGVCLILVVFAFNMADRRTLVKSIIWCLALIATVSAMPYILDLIDSAIRAFLDLWSEDGSGSGTSAGRGGANNLVVIHRFFESSLMERWVSIAGGLQLWFDHPIFGGGLGVFAERRLGDGEGILVIHSIPIWILGEFGLIGFLIVFSLPLAFAYRCRKLDLSRLPPHGVFMFGCCVTILVFGLPHDMSYQRILWLALGAATAAWALRTRPLKQRS